MITADLGLGPMSTEIIDAVFRYSHFYRKPLMIIASKNQIDHSGGYVNGWRTKEFMEGVTAFRRRYPLSRVAVCRDHCGPGFNGVDDLRDTYETIRVDIENGFDLIHIDFCRLKGTQSEQLDESKKAIQYCLSLKPDIRLEIGTDENRGTNYQLPVMDDLEREVDFFASFCSPEFYVVQTGSLVKEINQVGGFNASFARSVGELIRRRGLKLKEHNADYLSHEEIAARRGVVDAMNIAPQLGVVQTQIVLERCLVYGVRVDDFLKEVYDGKRWRKWLHRNRSTNQFLCCLIAGHYHFSSDSFRRIIERLQKHEDIRETIINRIVDLIHHYEQALHDDQRDHQDRPEAVGTRAMAGTE